MLSLEKRVNTSSLIFLTILLLALLTLTQKRESEETRSIAQLSGYVQTPIGGRPGTSDLQRPSLEELGIQEAPIIDKTMRVRQGVWGLYTGYQQIRAEGDARLQIALKTYGRLIPANTKLQSGIKFDVYRLGLAYRGIAIELVLLDFGYRFKTPEVASGRAYRHAGMRVGFTNSKGTTFISLPGWKKSGTRKLTITTKRTPIEIGINTHDKSISGWQSINIEFKDAQPLPNHLLLRAEGVYIRRGDLRAPTAGWATVGRPYKQKSLDW
jgi:hypothetical protein